MNAQDFINKWRRVELTERSASQQHFLDLCEVFGHEKPAEADPSGEWFTFERGAEKRAGGRGWADVWKRGFFGWEYKGRRRNLEAAYEQLQQYREALENPPLLVVCDMERFVVHTNFTAAVNQRHEIPLAALGEAHNLEVLRAVFHAPERLRPQATVASVTTEVAERLGGVAQALRARGLEPTEVARFLDRIVFCLFAEDVGLLPPRTFTQVAERALTPESFAQYVGLLFDAMRDGGEFIFTRIRHFDGNLFAGGAALPLTADEIEDVKAAARLDWGAVDPSVFGTLFERGLDPAKRSQLGAQYTGRADIETLIEPVVMRPLRREWEAAKAEAEALLARGTRPAHGRAQARVRAFHERLSAVTVLDPACGSGNFLYVTLQKLKDMEKEVNLFANDRELGSFLPHVNPTQFYGIEVNPYAFDLAQTTLWIGYLQWVHENGYGTPAEPILRPMTNFENKDAVLDLTDPARPREPDWPAVDFIVGNPPFLGSQRLRGELGNEYVDALHRLYEGRVPGGADLVAYWFEKARKHIEEGKAKRAGLLATQGIRGGASREVLRRIKESGDIFFAESDRAWILDGANVHISMVGFDNGDEEQRVLDGNVVPTINPNLTSNADITTATSLDENRGIAFQGPVKVGQFEVADAVARHMLLSPNPIGMSNSEVIRPWANGISITNRTEPMWIVDFHERPLEEAVNFEDPFEYVLRNVKPSRDKTRRERRRRYWWIHGEVNNALRRAVGDKARYVATCQTAKHRIFVWLPTIVLPAQTIIAFARDDDYSFGVLHSRIHEVWARAQGTQLREKESGFRYTPTTCFETFPFPEPSEEERGAVAEAARELEALRARWLNPPEWTREEVLEFPGSVEGPWARYVEGADARGTGTVRYPRLVARDEGAARELSRRTLTNLYNLRPAWLAHAHRRLDAAVAAAYGWVAAPPDEEILARLLELNRRRLAPASQP